MSITIPPELAWLSDVLAGQNWPASNEDGLKAIADAWYEAASGLAGLVNPAEKVSSQVSRSISGNVADQFTEFMAGLTRSLPQLADTANSIGDMMYEAFLDVQYAKLMILVIMFWAAEQIIELAQTIWGLTMIPEIEAVTRIIITAIAKQLLKSVLTCVVSTVGADAAIQGLQFALGERHEWNARSTLEWFEMGGLAGVVGELFHIGGDVLAPAFAKSFLGHVTLGGTAGVTVGELSNLAFGTDQNPGLAFGAGAFAGAFGSVIPHASRGNDTGPEIVPEAPHFDGTLDDALTEPPLEPVDLFGSEPPASIQAPPRQVVPPEGEAGADGGTTDQAAGPRADIAIPEGNDQAVRLGPGDSLDALDTGRLPAPEPPPQSGAGAGRPSAAERAELDRQLAQQQRRIGEQIAAGEAEATAGRWLQANRGNFDDLLDNVSQAKSRAGGSGPALTASMREEAWNRFTAHVHEIAARSAKEQAGSGSSTERAGRLRSSLDNLFLRQAGHETSEHSLNGSYLRQVQGRLEFDRGYDAIKSRLAGKISGLEATDLHRGAVSYQAIRELDTTADALRRGLADRGFGRSETPAALGRLENLAGHITRSLPKRLADLGANPPKEGEAPSLVHDDSPYAPVNIAWRAAKDQADAELQEKLNRADYPTIVLKRLRDPAENSLTTYFSERAFKQFSDRVAELHATVTKTRGDPAVSAESRPDFQAGLAKLTKQLPDYMDAAERADFWLERNHRRFFDMLDVGGHDLTGLPDDEKLARDELFGGANPPREDEASSRWSPRLSDAGKQELWGKLSEQVHKALADRVPRHGQDRTPPGTRDGDDRPALPMPEELFRKEAARQRDLEFAYREFTSRQQQYDQFFAGKAGPEPSGAQARISSVISDEGISRIWGDVEDVVDGLHEGELRRLFDPAVRDAFDQLDPADRRTAGLNHLIGTLAERFDRERAFEQQMTDYLRAFDRAVEQYQAHWSLAAGYDRLEGTALQVARAEYEGTLRNILLGYEHGRAASDIVAALPGRLKFLDGGNDVLDAAARRFSARVDSLDFTGIRDEVLKAIGANYRTDIAVKYSEIFDETNGGSADWLAIEEHYGDAATTATESPPPPEPAGRDAVPVPPDSATPISGKQPPGAGEHNDAASPAHPARPADPPGAPSSGSPPATGDRPGPDHISRAGPSVADQAGSSQEEVLQPRPRELATPPGHPANLVGRHHEAAGPHLTGAGARDLAVRQRWSDKQGELVERYAGIIRFAAHQDATVDAARQMFRQVLAAHPHAGSLDEAALDELEDQYLSAVTSLTLQHFGPLAGRQMTAEDLEPYDQRFRSGLSDLVTALGNHLDYLAALHGELADSRAVVEDAITRWQADPARAAPTPEMAANVYAWYSAELTGGHSQTWAPVYYSGASGLILMETQHDWERQRQELQARIPDRINTELWLSRRRPHPPGTSGRPAGQSGLPAASTEDTGQLTDAISQMAAVVDDQATRLGIPAGSQLVAATKATMVGSIGFLHGEAAKTGELTSSRGSYQWQRTVRHFAEQARGELTFQHLLVQYHDSLALALADALGAAGQASASDAAKTRLRQGTQAAFDSAISRYSQATRQLRHSDGATWQVEWIKSLWDSELTAIVASLPARIGFDAGLKNAVAEAESRISELLPDGTLPADIEQEISGSFVSDWVTEYASAFPPPLHDGGAFDVKTWLARYRASAGHAPPGPGRGEASDVVPIAGGIYLRQAGDDKLTAARELPWHFGWLTVAAHFGRGGAALGDQVLSAADLAVLIGSQPGWDQAAAESGTTPPGVILVSCGAAEGSAGADEEAGGAYVAELAAALGAEVLAATGDVEQQPDGSVRAVHAADGQRATAPRWWLFGPSALEPAAMSADLSTAVGMRASRLGSLPAIAVSPPAETSDGTRWQRDLAGPSDQSGWLPKRIAEEGRLSASDTVVSLFPDETAPWLAIERELSSRLGSLWEPVAEALAPMFDAGLIKPMLSALARGSQWKVPIHRRDWQGFVTLDARVLPGITRGEDIKKFEFEAGSESRTALSGLAESRQRLLYGLAVKLQDDGEFQDSGYAGKYHDWTDQDQRATASSTVSKSKTVEPAAMLTGNIEIGLRISLSHLGVRQADPAERHVVKVGARVAVPKSDLRDEAAVAQHYAPPRRITDQQRFGSSDVIWDVYPIMAGKRVEPHQHGATMITAIAGKVREVFGSQWRTVADAIAGQVDLVTLHQRLVAMGSGEPLSVNLGSVDGSVDVTARVVRLRHARGTEQTEFNTGTETLRTATRMKGKSSAIQLPTPGLLEMQQGLPFDLSVSSSWQRGHDTQRIRHSLTRTGMATKTKVPGEVFDGEIELRFEMRGPSPRGAPEVATARLGVRAVVERAEAERVKTREETVWDAPVDLPGPPGRLAAETRATAGLPVPPLRVWQQRAGTGGLKDTYVVRDLYRLDRLRTRLDEGASEFFGPSGWREITPAALDAFNRDQLMSNLTAMTRQIPLEAPELLPGTSIQATARVATLVARRPSGKGTQLAPQGYVGTRLSDSRFAWWLVQGQFQPGGQFTAAPATDTFLASIGYLYRRRTGWRTTAGGRIVANSKFPVNMEIFDGTVDIDFVLTAKQSSRAQKKRLTVTLPFEVAIPAGDIRKLTDIGAKGWNDGYQTAPQTRADYLPLAEFVGTGTDLATAASGYLAAGPVKNLLPPQRLRDGRLGGSDFVLSFPDDRNDLVEHISGVLAPALGAGWDKSRRDIRAKLDSAAVKPLIPTMTNGDAVVVPVSGNGWSGNVTVTASVRHVNYHGPAPDVEFENGTVAISSGGTSTDGLHRRILGMLGRFKIHPVSTAVQVTRESDQHHNWVVSSGGRAISTGKTVEDGAIFRGQVVYHVSFNLSRAGFRLTVPGEAREVAVVGDVMTPERDALLDQPEGPTRQAPAKFFTVPDRISRQFRLSSSDIVQDVAPLPQPDRSTGVTALLASVQKTGREVFGRHWAAMRRKILDEVSMQRVHYEMKGMMARAPIVVAAPPGLTGKVSITAELIAAAQASNTDQTEFNVGTALDRVRMDAEATELPSTGAVASVRATTGPIHGLPVAASAGGNLSGRRGHGKRSVISTATMTAATTKAKVGGVAFDGSVVLHFRMEHEPGFGKARVKTAPSVASIRFLSEQLESTQVAEAAEAEFLGARPTAAQPPARVSEPVWQPPPRIWRTGPAGGVRDTDVIRGLPDIGGLHQAVEIEARSFYGERLWRKIAPAVRGGLRHDQMSSALPSMTRGEVLLSPLALGRILHPNAKFAARAQVLRTEYRRVAKAGELAILNQVSQRKAGASQLWRAAGFSAVAGVGLGFGPVSLNLDLLGGGQYQRRSGILHTNGGRVVSNAKFTETTVIYDADVLVMITLRDGPKTREIKGVIPVQLGIPVAEHTEYAPPGTTVFYAPGEGPMLDEKPDT